MDEIFGCTGNVWARFTSQLLPVHLAFFEEVKLVLVLAVVQLLTNNAKVEVAPEHSREITGSDL